MQLIIDIPESIIEHITDGSFGTRPNDRYALITAVMNGTPLPKGRWEYRDMALAKSCVASCSNCGYMNFSYRTPYCPNCLAIMEEENDTEK